MASEYAVCLGKRDMDHPVSYQWYEHFMKRWPELKLVLVTVIGCGNALGIKVPPFFIFPGTRMREELMTGNTPGAQGTVSESGWPNGDIFRTYLEDHLIRYLPERSEDNQVLILYDGHRSRVNLGPIEWARQQHIILFVLPAHTSHVLQPLDIGCFGSFERIFNSTCYRYMRDHCGEVITKYNICALGCSAYSRALSVENLQSSFRRAGIFPFSTEAVDASNFRPAEVQEQVEADQPLQEQQPATVGPCGSVQLREFFNSKQQPLVSKKRSTKKRRLVFSIVSGMAITEEAVVEKIQNHQIAMSKPSKKKKTAPASPLPGPSRIKPRTQPQAAPTSLFQDHLESNPEHSHLHPHIPYSTCSTDVVI